MANLMDFADVLLLDAEELANYANSLSADELDALKMEFQNHVDALNAKRRIIDPISDQRAADVQAAKMYDGLTDVQKASMAQYIQAQGISNSGKIGK